MSDLEQFQEIIHGVQALRRLVERNASPFQGATGIRAQFYPHQLQTVLRILTDSQVRHLIADEVGLGKTVQALMIMNALRLQRARQLCVAIVVPSEQRARQWSDEVLGRAHTAAVLDEVPQQSKDWLKVLWPAKIINVAQDLDPAVCDLLILDEIQSLRADILNHVARRSAEFQHLMLLTATPDLRSSRSECRLLQMIEPDRVEWARREVARVVGQEEGESTLSLEAMCTPVSELNEERQRAVIEQIQSLQRRALEQDSTVYPAIDLTGLNVGQRRKLFTKAWWMFRRVIRARRADYPEHLPQRKEEVQCIEPLGIEVERLRKTQAYLHGYLERGGEPGRVALIARRAAIGGESLRDRVADLQRDGRDPYQELEAIRDLCGFEFGDSRLDELTDWLADYWRLDPLQKVIIAAQDNPTIRFLENHLKVRLPEVGRRGRRMPLTIVVALQEQDRPEHDLVDAYLAAAMMPFQNGTAQLLIAHDDYRESYNLQAAGALVFYSIPWNPHDVDQWIGRVDRLGREVIDPKRPWTKPRPVCIVSITQRDQLDERIVRIHQECGVFKRPLELDPDVVQRIADRIQQAGLGMGDAGFETLSEDIRKSEQPEVDDLLDAPFPVWTPEAAAALHLELRKAKPVEPVARHAQKLGYVSSDTEAALAQWLGLLKKHKYYRFVPNRDVQEPDNRALGFLTLSYARMPPISLDTVDALPTPRWSPFFIPRKNIGCPPRPYVTLAPRNFVPEQARRSLQFLNHGSSLHEDLIATWRRLGRRTGLEKFELSVKRSHLAADTPVTPGYYFIGVGEVDPATPIDIESKVLELTTGLGDAPNQTQETMRAAEMRTLQANLEADVRFTRAHLPAQLGIEGARRTAEGWAWCENRQLLYDLLTPVWDEGDPPHCESVTPATLELEKFTHAANKLKKHIADSAVSVWRRVFPAFREAVRERLTLLQIETEDRITNLLAEMREIEQAIGELERWQSEYNNRRIQLTYRPRLVLTNEEILLVRRRFEIRKACLQAVVENAESPEVELYRSLGLQVAFLD